MTPRIQRVDPPYMQVVNHIRKRIADGELAEGDLIPSLRAIQREYEISNATAVKAVTALKAEGLVEAVEGIGVRVAQPRAFVSGPDRLQLQRSTGSGFRSGEQVELISADLVGAPVDVALALDLGDGDQVVQRRRIYRDDKGVVALSTSWLPGELAEAAPELLVLAPLPTMTFGLIEERTGRRASKRQDIVAMRHLPQDAAQIMGLETGTQVLTMVNRYWDQTGRPTEYALDYLGLGRELSAEYAI